MSRSLRIALVCHQDLGGEPHPVPSYRFWRTYLKHGLQEVGHRVVEIPDVDWARGLVPQTREAVKKWRSDTWARAIRTLAKEHRREHIDLFLGYLYPNQILPGAIQEIKDQGIPCVNFFCDNVREFRKLPAEFRPFDLHWVPELEAVEMYRRAGWAHLHAPMPCWVAPRNRRIALAEEFGPVFIGRRDELRAELLAEAIQLGLGIRIFGSGWLGEKNTEETDTRLRRKPFIPTMLNQWSFVRQHGWRALGYKLSPRHPESGASNFDFSAMVAPALDDQAYWHAMHRSQVCLGINRYPSPRHPPGTIKTYSRLRDIEAPMAGACYLTEWAEGIESLYEPGKEIETYRNAAEMVEKCNRLQAEPAMRSELRIAAQKRALSDHSVGNTISRIGSALGID